jgi:hypothetical protein
MIFGFPLWLVALMVLCELCEHSDPNEDVERILEDFGWED